MRRVIVSIGMVAIIGSALALMAQNPPAYVMAKVTITDPAAYEEYRSGFGGVFAQYGGEILAVSSDPTVLEGEWEATTTVLIRFDSRDEALAWYNSDGYQELVGLRQAASTADFIVFDGRP